MQRKPPILAIFALRIPLRWGDREAHHGGSRRRFQPFPGGEIYRTGLPIDWRCTPVPPIPEEKKKEKERKKREKK